MSKILPASAQPTPLPRERRYPCRPSCCKTPYMCAKKRACQCHTMEDSHG